MIGDNVVSYLQSKGVGTRGVDLFLNFMPDSPNDCLVVYDSIAPQLPESSCLTVDNLGIQLPSRSENTVTAMQKIKEAHKIVAGLGGFALLDGGDTVSYSRVESSPHSIGVDDKNRHEWTAHYEMRVESKEGDENRL